MSIEEEQDHGRIRIWVNSGAKMSRGKYAAAAVHAALTAAGVHPGVPVIVLGGQRGHIEHMRTVIRDAGRTEVEPGTATAGTDYVFEQAHTAHAKPFDTSPERVRIGADSLHVTPTDDERARVEQSNEVAGIVFDQVKRVWPDLHPVLDLRYGIADALWDAGFRLTAQGEPANATEPDVALHSPDEMQHNVQDEPNDAQVWAAQRALSRYG